MEALAELENLNPNRKFNLILIDKTLEDIDQHGKQFIQTIYPKATYMDFNIAIILYFASKGVGYLYSKSGEV